MSNMCSRYMPMVDYTKIEASAPGRFVLVGEYTDLYEKNAIAIAIDKRTKVTIRPYKEGRLRLNLKNYNDVREWPTTAFTMVKLVTQYSEVMKYSESFLPKLNHLLHKRYYHNADASRMENNDIDFNKTSDKDPDPDLSKQADDSVMAFLMTYVALGDSYAWSARPYLDIEVESTVPIGKGLGSSSAYGVSLCAALLKAFRISAEPLVISNWSLNFDVFMHGVSSGLNTSVVVHGGYLYYQHSKVKAYGIPHLTPIKGIFIDTGVSRDSRSLIKLLNKQLKDHPHRVKEIFNSISDLASQTWRKINDTHFVPKSIASDLIANQELLESLGLGNDKLVEICTKGNLLRLPIKQTHHGQTAFLLYDDSYKCKYIYDFKKEMDHLGYKYETHSVGCDGLKVSVTLDQFSED